MAEITMLPVYNNNPRQLDRGMSLPQLTLDEQASEFPDVPSTDHAAYQALPVKADNNDNDSSASSTAVVSKRALGESSLDELDTLAAARTADVAEPVGKKGYSERMMELLAPRTRAKTELPMHKYTDSDERPSAYTRTRNYAEQNPRRCCAIVCCACCCIVLIVLVALAVGLLLPITDSTLKEGATVVELTNVCDPQAIAFKVNAVLNNPAPIGATMLEWDLNFDLEGKRLAHARMPGFPFGAGDGQPIALESALAVDDEAGLADMFNRFFRDEPLVIDVVADVRVAVLGVPVSTQLKLPIFLNTTEEQRAEKKAQGGSAKLRSLKVTESNADVLAALVKMLFNQSSELLIVNMPRTDVDIFFAGARVANASVAPNRLAFGLNPWDVTAVINSANASTSGELAGHFVNNEAFNITLRGAEHADRSCFLQRLLTERIVIGIPFDAKPGGNSSLALDRLAFQQIGRRNIDFTLDVKTVLGFEIEGTVPQFTLDVSRDARTPLAQINVTSFPFLTTKASVPISVVVTDTRATFDAGFALFRNEFVSVLVRGRTGPGATVFDRVLAALAFTFEANRMLSAPTMSDTEVQIKKLLLLDADASTIKANLEVALPPLLSFAVVAKVSGIFVELVHKNAAAVRLRFDIDADLPGNFSTLIAATVVDARLTADFASTALDGKLSAVRVRGQAMFENVLGEMLQFLDTSFDLGNVSASADTSFSFDAVDVGSFAAQSVDVTAKLRLSDALRIETQVPLPTATLAFLRGRTELLRAAFQIEVVNNVVSLRLTVSVTDAAQSGKLLGDVVNAGPTDRIVLTVSGVSGTGNVIGTVLSFMQFNVTLADGMPPNVMQQVATAKKLVTIDRIDLVGNLNYRAHFVVAMSLADNVINLAMPQLELEIVLGGVRAFVIGLEELTLRRNTASTALKFYIAVVSQANVNAGLNTLLGAATPNIAVRGAQPGALGTPTDNLLQRVLAQFSTTFLLTDDRKPKTMTVDGGVVPVFKIVVKESTRDTLRVDLSLAVGMPAFVTFPISFGDLDLNLVVQGATIINIKRTALSLVQGNNDVHLDVLVTALNNRKALETAVSAFALGTGFSASISGQLGGPTLNVPVGLQYDFTLPADAGGGDSSFVECVEMSKMTLSGLSSIVGGTCSVTLDLNVFMRNPLPFSITLQKLNYRAEFNDLDGAICAFGNCLFPPKNDVLIGTVAVQPKAVLPSATTLAVPQTLDGTQAGGQGSWNEVCARLGSAFILNNDLRIDIEGGVANLNIDKFNIDISFSLANFFIDKNEKRPCDVRIAEKRKMKAAMMMQ